MTTPTLPPHGTTARANGRRDLGIPRCPCTPCRQAERRYNKHRTYLKTTGRPLLVPAQPVIDHLNALFAAGPGWKQIAQATGTSSATIHNILHGQQYVRRSIADRILAVHGIDDYAARRLINATGSIRRVRALMAIGHACKTIQKAAGLDHSVIWELVNARTDQIHASTAHKIRAAYKQLAYVQGGSVRSRRRAEREGWASPLRWDDDLIDDPTAEPDAGREAAA
ncbi:MAG: hypothetical protein HOW97_34015 [Catenulispora sp.]|nr:hypothetical protein [Catenulispora sp.]